MDVFPHYFFEAAKAELEKYKAIAKEFLTDDA